MINQGDRVSNYTIVSPLGSGGMGKVFLARDTKLDRAAAIKFLHPEFVQNAEALRRFSRESKAASALNHPNIITIYEIGEHDGLGYIAMEFVEGKNLREFIRDRSLDIMEILDITIQVASALGAAHEKGIVHRDIKPENIIRRPDHLVKVLDFGLAKQVSEYSDSFSSDPEAPTRAILTTEPGFVIGTAAYMSPEQARGKPTDSRSDIWSLGVVLYEMLTGQLPFEGETKSDMVASILRSDPRSLSITPPELSHEFEHIFKKAFGKDREERYQVVKDLILDLKIIRNELTTDSMEIFGSAPAETERFAVTTQDEGYHQTERVAARRWPRYLVPIAAVVAVAAIWLGWQATRADRTATALSTMQLATWKSEKGEGDATGPRISPDGKLIAYAASRKGKGAIWLKQIDGGEPFTQKRDDDSTDASPIWSPDGGQIAFFSDRGGRSGIWTAPTLGGTPSLITPITMRPRLIRWSGTTIYIEMGPDLYSFDMVSKELSKLTDFDSSQPMERQIAVSPDETQIAYADIQEGRSDIWLATIRGGSPRRLTDDETADASPLWHPDGRRLVYNCERNSVKQICVVPVDGGRAVQITTSDTDNYLSDISADGKRIVYTTMKDDADLWGISVDGGREFQVTSDVGVEFWPDISRDGNSVAYQAIRRLSSGGQLLSCLLLTRQFASDVPPEQIAADGFMPRWSPDGKSIAFLRTKDTTNQLWVAPVNGGVPRQLTENAVFFGGYTLLPFDRLQNEDISWSPDGGSLIYVAMRDGTSNVWQSFVDGTADRQLSVNDQKSILFFNPVPSPDGRRIAWSGMTTESLDKRRWSVWVWENGNAVPKLELDRTARLVGWIGNDRLTVRAMASRRDAGIPADVTLIEVNATTGVQSEVSRLPTTYFASIAVSPDGGSIAYVANTESGDAIKFGSLSRGGFRTVIATNEERVYFSRPVFAPDGKTLYYSKQANWQVISMLTNFD